MAQIRPASAGIVCNGITAIVVVRDDGHHRQIGSCKDAAGLKSDWTHIWKRNIWALKVSMQDAHRFVQGHTIAVMHGRKKSESEPSGLPLFPLSRVDCSCVINCLICVLAGASVEAACGRDRKCLTAEHSNIKAE